MNASIFSLTSLFCQHLFSVKKLFEKPEPTKPKISPGRLKPELNERVLHSCAFFVCVNYVINKGHTKSPQIDL